jgi:glucose-1-phosphate thymidylyltransferase
VIEKRQSKKIGCIEEVAYLMGYIDAEQMKLLVTKYIKSGYGAYLQSVLDQ